MHWDEPNFKLCNTNIYPDANMVLDGQVGAIIYVRGTRILYFKSEEKTNGDTFFLAKTSKEKPFTVSLWE